MTHSDDALRADAYLIVKHGLYYRPSRQGYTGLKSDAGRYTLDDVAVHFPNRDSPNQDGMEYVHEDDAPEYSPRCPWDVRLVDQTARRAIEVALNEAAQAAYRALAPVSLDYSDENERILRRAEKEARLITATCIRALSPDDILKKVKDNE